MSSKQNKVEIHQGDETRADRGSSVTVNKTDSGKWIASLFFAMALVVALAWGVNRFRVLFSETGIEGGNDNTEQTDPR